MTPHCNRGADATLARCNNALSQAGLSEDRWDHAAHPIILTRARPPAAEASPGFLGHLFPRRSACRLSNLRRSGQKATLLPELRRFDHTE